MSVQFGMFRYQTGRAAKIPDGGLPFQSILLVNDLEVNNL